MTLTELILIGTRKNQNISFKYVSYISEDNNFLTVDDKGE